MESDKFEAIDREKVVACEALYREIQVAAEKVRDIYCSIWDLSTEYLYFYRVDFDGGSDGYGAIQFRGDEYWQFGGHEAHSLELPLRYLCTTDWIDEEKAKVEAEKQAKIAASATDAERSKREELAMLERLKAKYPDHSR